MAFIFKPKKRVFPGFFSQLPETWVLKLCPELETLSVRKRWGDVHVCSCVWCGFLR